MTEAENQLRMQVSDLLHREDQYLQSLTDLENKLVLAKFLLRRTQLETLTPALTQSIEEFLEDHDHD